MEGNEYGVTTTEMDQIMTMDLDDMTESQKEIWRKETMKRINETTKITKTVLEKWAETRRRHEISEEETKKLNERWKDFEDRFNTSIKKLCVKIVQTLEGSGLTQNMDQIKEESKYSPEKMSSKEAAKLLKK